MSRTWSSSPVVAVRPLPARWNGTSRWRGSVIAAARPSGSAATWTYAVEVVEVVAARVREHDLKRLRMLGEVLDDAARDRGEQASALARLVRVLRRQLVQPSGSSSFRCHSISAAMREIGLRVEDRAAAG